MGPRFVGHQAAPVDGIVKEVDECVRSKRRLIIIYEVTPLPSVPSGVLDNPAVLSLSEPEPARSTVVAVNNQTVRRTGLLGPAAAALHDSRARHY